MLKWARGSSTPLVAGPAWHGEPRGSQDSPVTEVPEPPHVRIPRRSGSPEYDRASSAAAAGGYTF